MKFSITIKYLALRSKSPPILFEDQKETNITSFFKVVADNYLLIISAYTGWPGCTHDARVLKKFGLYRKAELVYTLFKIIIC